MTVLNYVPPTQQMYKIQKADFASWD